MFAVAILAASLTAQFIAGMVALRLIFITKDKKAWGLISLGLCGMALRRGINLAHSFTAGNGVTLDPVFETVGLATSLFMLAGVLMISPLFLQMKKDKEEALSLAKEKEDLAESLRAALANIRVLAGLLPICASCKKIRDDKGYWHQVESYIQHETGTRFSHSICPDCIEKLYPELAPKRGEEE